jgi:polyisoprenoid-binding protein YceI
MLKRLALTLATVILAAPLFAATDTYTVDKSHSEVNFKVRHLVNKVTGKFTDFTSTVIADPARPTASSVEFSITATSVDTSSADRDKHLRSADFFDVEKFPTITFKSTSITPTKTKNVYAVTGDFTLRGVTKRMTIPVTFLGFAKDPWGNNRAGFELATKLNRKDFGFNWNKALDNGGFLVGDDVDIDISLEMVQKKPAA